MHRLIRDQAGHVAIADAMKFVDHNRYDLGRLDAERRSETKAVTTTARESAVVGA